MLNIYNYNFHIRERRLFVFLRSYLEVMATTRRNMKWSLRFIVLFIITIYWITHFYRTETNVDAAPLIHVWVIFIQINYWN